MNAAHQPKLSCAEVAALSELCTDDFPVVLLKGGAYLLQEQAIAVGRFVSDVDLLVPRDHLRTMEHRLRSAGVPPLPTSTAPSLWTCWRTTWRGRSSRWCSGGWRSAAPTRPIPWRRRSTACSARQFEKRSG